MSATPAVAEREMLGALRPWTRRLAIEAALRWLVRGAILALGAASLILAVGWLAPLPAADLRALAVQLATPVLLGGLVIGLWPAKRVNRAAELDARLHLADRLATAWVNRSTQTPMAQLQRSDALSHLAGRSPSTAITFKVPRLELGLLATLAALALILAVAPSPMESVLRQMAADQRATEQAAAQLEALRRDPSLAENLTADQARSLDELLQRARLEVSQARTPREAAAALARAQQQLLQVADPSADARAEALGAMSETLTQEPLTRRLGDALQRTDARAAAAALQALRESNTQLSDAQRQALARALQRAANVGRADSRGSAALRDAARAVAAGERADAPFQEATASIEEAMQATAADTALRAVSQRVQDVRTGLGTGSPGASAADQGLKKGDGQAFMPGPPGGTAVPIDSAFARRSGGAGVGQAEPAPGQRSNSGGQGGADPGGGQPMAAAEPGESIFIPGRLGDGPADNNDAVQQPFTVRGAPRPYREVIAQYAQDGRDYVDRAAVPPNVRDLVRQYFADLEGQ